MQMTTDARVWLSAAVRRILGRHPLADAERAGITYELMSHLHAAGEARATAAGRSEVTREDLEAALAEAGGEDELATAFIQPLAQPIERVLFGRRLGAFVIDAVLLFILLAFVHTALVFFLRPVMGGGTGVASHHLPAGDASDDMAGWWQIMPWGYHDLALPPAMQAVIGGVSALIVLGYFTWFEARQSRTLGKRALELRVMRLDRQPMTYRESLIRNLVKVIFPLLILDTLIMLIAFYDDKQRGSDKIAQTIVVRS